MKKNLLILATMVLVIFPAYADKIELPVNVDVNEVNFYGTNEVNIETVKFILEDHSIDNQTWQGLYDGSQGLSLPNEALNNPHSLYIAANRNGSTKVKDWVQNKVESLLNNKAWIGATALTTYTWSDSLPGSLNFAVLGKLVFLIGETRTAAMEFTCPNVIIGQGHTRDGNTPGGINNWWIFSNQLKDNDGDKGTYISLHCSTSSIEFNSGGKEFLLRITPTRLSDHYTFLVSKITPIL